MPNKSAMRVLQLTDCHLLADPQARLKNVPTRDTLVEVLEFVKERFAVCQRPPNGAVGYPRWGCGT